MVNLNFIYKYAEIEEYESQYGEDCLETGCPVEAVYIRAKVEMDKGNPFIEALPLPRVNKESLKAYENEILGYRYDKASKLPKLEKFLQLSTLRHLRFILPFHKELEIKFYNALLESYRLRHFSFSQYEGIKCTVNDSQIETAGRIIGESSDSANSGFSLIGYSGCGKSTAIHTLVSHYPQVIVHKTDTGGYFMQIVYLVVNCVANSNFAALYEGIGEAIDRALGNNKSVYAAEIAKTPTLGRKAEKVKEYIDKLGIGAIIFDEIQLIDFSSTKENSFESLLTLVNRTKIALIVIGTEDAKEKMFSNLRTARRVGPSIAGDLYCTNRDFFTILVKSLFRYQWFDVPVSASKEITDALYDVTKGIVDQLISVYIAMHFESLTQKDTPIIVDADFVHKVAGKYYSGMQEILAQMDFSEKLEHSKEIRKKAEQMMSALVENEKQESEMRELISEAKGKERMVSVLNNVADTIKAIYDYPDKEIKNAFNKISSETDITKLSEKEISRKIVQYIETKKTKQTKSKSATPKTKSKLTVEAMKSYLEV